MLLVSIRVDSHLADSNWYTICKLSQARRNFKHMIRRKRWAYDKWKTEKLIVSRKSNVKEYWRMLKRAANIDSKSTISSETFSKYFQCINNPNDRFYQADFCQLVFKILRKKQILTSIKGRSSVANLRKTKIYNTNLDLVTDNVYTNFGLILSIRSQDIEQKPNFDINQGP